ncbi:kelch repeat-containing protein [Aquimarina rubra]|uniref:Kelch repeat-containing protein n=1 Tax=Aquimarina rubra TaxID=1920033 RepID=A0ABW5LGJ2_9FLAO
MNKFLFYLNLFLIVFMISCGSDDDVNPTDETINIDETIEILTNNSQKSWRIEKAILTNSSNAQGLDISDVFNMDDDVFVFSTESVDNPNLAGENGSVIWKQREGVNWEATSIDEVYMDFYEKQELIGFKITEESTFKGFDGLFDFSIVDENTITGKIKVSATAELDITLVPLLEMELPIIPTSINFIEIATLQFDAGSSSSILGVEGSNELNSLFIVKRGMSDIANPNGCDYILEEIGKYNVSTNTFESTSFCAGNNFSTKEPEIINGKLIVASSDANNVYDIDLSSDPKLVRHDKTLTRHGTASLQDDVYVIGSRLNPLDDGEPSNKLYTFNTITEDFTVFGELPIAKSRADVEIVDDKLYIFGGTEEFQSTVATNDILIYDFDTTTWETKSMTKAVDDTFTAKYKNLIFVGGNIFIYDTNGGLQRKEPFIGVFNTLDSSFNEVAFDFDSPLYADGQFRQLTVLNNKLYVIFDAESMFGGTFKIYEAELD